MGIPRCTSPARATTSCRRLPPARRSRATRTSPFGEALADLNLDGLLDLVVVNRRENVSLWRNVGTGTAEEPRPMGNWIALRLRQPGANREAIGAWVEVELAGTTLQRE